MEQIQVAAAPAEICPACNQQHLILTGGPTKQAVYQCPHAGAWLHVTRRFQRSYDPVTKWTPHDTEAAATWYHALTAQHDLKHKQRWVFREVRRGKLWKIGNKRGAITVKHMAGFYDFRHAINHMWEGEIALTELPGRFKPAGIGDTEFNDVLSGVEVAPGLFVKSSFNGPRSEPIAGYDLLTKFHAEAANLRALRDAGNDVQAELDVMVEEIKECYVPGGGLKRLDADVDPLFKVYDAARKRKARAIKALKDAGLLQIAEHLDEYYRLRVRTWSYCPDHKPHWIPQKGASSNSLYGDIVLLPSATVRDDRNVSLVATGTHG